MSPNAAPRDDAVEEDPATTAGPPPTLVLFAGGGVGAGIVPSIDPLAVVELRWRFAGAWLLRGVGLLLPEQEVTLVDSGSVGFSAWLGQVAVCPGSPWEGALGVRLCAGALVGGITSTARSLDRPRDPTRPYVATTLALDVAWQLGSGLSLRAGATGLAALVRDRFVAQDADGLHTAHRPSAFGGFVDAGLGYAFF